MSDINSQIQLWRQKAREGTLTQDEMREAVAALRRERIGASESSAKSKERKGAAKAKANINSENLLDELGGL